ncbi:hypothetical protein O9992_04305 [Vibrio lentus]|nr:hypothetical protein [Vibrio lentus]
MAILLNLVLPEELGDNTVVDKALKSTNCTSTLRLACEPIKGHHKLTRQKGRASNALSLFY